MTVAFFRGVLPVIAALAVIGAASSAGADGEKTMRGQGDITAKAGDKQAKLPVASVCGNARKPAGRWISNFGEVAFSDTSASPLDALYGHEGGRLVGRLTGQVFEGKWTQTAADTRCPSPLYGSRYWGKAKLTFNKTFDRFTGSWDYCGSSAPADHHWSGYRICPDALPKDGALAPGTVWVNQLDDKSWQEARKADCSCHSVTLGYAKVRMYNERTKLFRTSTVYDLWDATKAPPNLSVPVLNWHAGWHPSYVIPPTHRPDRICFQFTFPKLLAYLRRQGGSHPCDVQVTLHYPRAISGTPIPSYTDTYRLFMVYGTGGTVNPGSVFSGGTDGRKILANEVCMLPLNRYNSIGPAGATGYVEWKVRGARELKRYAPQETCARVNFTMK
jgi:hypothetical protein